MGEGGVKLVIYHSNHSLEPSINLRSPKEGRVREVGVAGDECRQRHHGQRDYRRAVGGRPACGQFDD